MYNIYDVFESRKEAHINYLFNEVQESFVEFELLQNNLQQQQIVLEQSIYKLDDFDSNEYIVEGFIKEKVNKLINFLKAQWNKLREWFKAILDKILKRGNTKEKIEKKLELAVVGGGNGNTDNKNDKDDGPIEANYREVDSQDVEPNNKSNARYNSKQLGDGRQRLNAPKQQSNSNGSKLKLNAPKQQEQPKKQQSNTRIPTIKEVLMSKGANRFTIEGERPADPNTIQSRYVSIAGLIMQHASAVFSGQTNEDIASVIMKKFNIKNNNTAELQLYSVLTDMVRNEKGSYHVKDIANEIMDYLDNKDTLVKMVKASEQKINAGFSNMISNLEKLGDSDENQNKLAMVQKDMAMHVKLTQMFVQVLNDSYNRISTIAEKATDEYIRYELKHGAQ